MLGFPFFDYNFPEIYLGMKSLERIKSYKQVRAIVNDEERLAINDRGYLPYHYPALLNDVEKAILLSRGRDQLFLDQNRKKIDRLEKQIIRSYKKSGKKYLKEMEGNHLSALRHLMKTTDISFEQAYIQAQEMVNEFSDGVYTLTSLFQAMELKLGLQMSEVT